MFGFSRYEDKLDDMERHLSRVNEEIAYLGVRVQLLESTLKILLEHLELKEVKVEAFTQLVKMPKP